MSKSLIAAVIVGLLMIAGALWFVQWRAAVIQNLTLTPEANKVMPV
jgi:hypothetical protein